MAAVIGTGIQRSGKASAISVDSVTLALSKWNCTEEGDDLDTGNFDSGGLGEGILGFVRLRYTAGGAWDAGVNPIDNPPGIFVRDDLPNLILVINTFDDTDYNMPFARVRSVTVGTDVKGLVTFDWSGMSQGSYLAPTGSV